MKIYRILSFLFALVLSLGSASAQVTLPKKLGETRSTGTMRTEIEKMTGSMVDAKTGPVDHAMQTDDRLDEIARKMDERSWGSENTAWEKACQLNTRESYQKYTAMYPYGAHISEATKRLIDIEVNDALNGAHNGLPNMKHVEIDDDSPTSTVVVENATHYLLTVYYSGEESKSVQISPGAKRSVTLKNGHYRIAASVPAPRVRPYAGSETFVGGRYEVGYIVVGDW